MFGSDVPLRFLAYTYTPARPESGLNNIQVLLIGSEMCIQRFLLINV